MRKVLFVADQVSPVRGMERALADLIRLLGDELDCRTVALSGRARATFPGEVDLLGLPSGAARLAVAVPRLRRLFTAAASPEPGHRDTVVVAVGVWAALPTLLAAGGRSAPEVLVWEHSLLPWRLENERRVRVLAGLVYRRLARRIHGVVAVSGGVRRTVQEFSAGRLPVTAVPNVLSEMKRPEAPAEVPAHRQGRVQLLGVGGLVHLKNWALALRALALLPEEYSLAIAGEGAGRPALQRLIADLGLTGRATLLGHREDVPDLLRTCDVVVHPSYVETFGYTLAEAAGAGKPLVCLDMPVMNDLVPARYPGSISPDSPEQYAAAIRRVVQEARQGSAGVGLPGNEREVAAAWRRLLTGGGPTVG